MSKPVKRKRNTDTLEQMRALARNTLQSPTPENVASLLEYCQDQEPPVVHGAITSLAHLFQKQSEKGSFDDSTPEHVWLRESRMRYIESLLDLLSHADVRLQVSVINLAHVVGKVVGCGCG